MLDDNRNNAVVEACMRTVLLLATLPCLIAATPAAAEFAQTLPSGSTVCLDIAPTDMLQPADQAAALRLLARQFELEGHPVATEGCTQSYTVSHVRLGDRIFITLAGRNVSRDATAIGLDDLPAVYNQMVRSIVRNKPMGSFSVVDRTNVMASQATPQRVKADSFGYARLGYGAIVGDRTYATPALGFGYRVELDRFGVDVAFLNVQTGNNAAESGAFAGSVLKLSGLYYVRPQANRTAYVGAGLSWGGVTFGTQSDYDFYSSGWHGSGLQAEVTGGYELARATTLRTFVQVDAILPFYDVRSERYLYPRPGVPVRPTVTTSRRYAPSVVASLGIGWQRNRK
jgi:hypothetical protein